MDKSYWQVEEALEAFLSVKQILFDQGLLSGLLLHLGFWGGTEDVGQEARRGRCGTEDAVRREREVKGRTGQGG